MIERNVLVRDRQRGKTTWLFDQIHDLVLANRAHEVLVVVADTQRMEFTKRYWHERFPALRFPTVITIGNTLPTRGRRYSKIFVEDIQETDFGINEAKIQDLLPCLAYADDPEITFTASPYPPFPDPPTKYELAMKAAEERRRVRAARKAFEDALMLAKMKHYIERSDSID